MPDLGSAVPGADLAAQVEMLKVALIRSCHLGEHMLEQVPEFTGVIGPGGEREDDSIRDGIAEEYQGFREVLARLDGEETTPA